MRQPSLPRTLPGYRHIKRYWDFHNNTAVAKILPGEYYVTRHDEILMTVVGSCVAACIRDSVSGIGGMNHFMLPHISIDKWEHTRVSAATRYGSFAMEYLINEILKHGSGQRKNLEVKLFGGGRIMKNLVSIGQKNIDFVKSYIQTESLNLLAEDLGGIYPRKILFYPINGRVRVKKLRAMEPMVLQRENAYRRNLENQPIAGDVDLF
ncbi:MAG: chemoreceptor glutamine deamidase CheD [Candidatus Parabeggiatoa sp. nov. 3]|nr:MAG: chemoreceptor glutamine deamidase CheD [Gammaproteobacteria bacterium]RKZ65558.1 MAG: chemoreceptor glutamine deamidase CheD [Gammaproteobacteria bacterium]RKZ87375.1 MAG: chemoreceptor glutamine deamidase CheD [Gammaproteobacteria bacterium]HEW97026.1 chemoreceptor glutamine deamidase CheD [Beggiatoa sp.]